MPATGLRALVPPITGDPSPHGLLGGCVPVVTTSDLHELNGTDLMSGACGPVGQWQDCPTGTWVNPEDGKVFNRPVACTFEPITAYAGIECSTFGLTQAEAEMYALDALRMGEQFALEDFFMRNFLCTNAVDLTPDDATGALHFAQGLGLLEMWLAASYGGTGVIHVPAGAAGLFATHGLTCDCADCPRTLMGNGVVLGAGYAANLGPGGDGACVEPEPGEAWLYATPPMRIRRDAPSVVPTGERGSINTRTNDRRVLAESTFVAEVACCMAAAVRVSLAT